MPDKNKLSIYMIKKEFTDNAKIIEGYDRSIKIDRVGTLYINSSCISIPSWVNSFLAGHITTDDIFTANARAALIVDLCVNQTGEIKKFALTFGYGKNMLKENTVEERFGLRVILNTIKPDSLRRINKINIGGNQKLSNEQLPLKSGINDFGLDIHRDLVSYIAGVSDDEAYVKGILAGGDILTLSAEVDISNIVGFLHSTYSKYSLTTYRDNFSWIDQIQDVKDTRIIDMLNAELISSINAHSTDIWMAVPDIIEWSEIRGFKYCGKDIFDDIHIDKVIESFRDPLISIEQLKSKRINALSALDDHVMYSWGANRCLYGELNVNAKAYCINGGKWYRIDNDFVAQVNSDYSATAISQIQFDDFTDTYTSEKSYSNGFRENHIDEYIVMDGQNLSYGGGNSKIELCDILSRDKKMIHIKPYSGSSTLSHLFNQATVSAELVLSDVDFLDSANTKIAEITDNREFQIIDRRSISIVFGIISKNHSDLPHIPFFSKVSFRHTKRRLGAFGFDVSVKTIRDIR